AGVAQPRFDLVRDETRAVAVAERIGYPVVVKPRGAGASIGVVLAADAEDVRDAFHAAEEASLAGAPEYMGGALVEEYLTGPEIVEINGRLGGDVIPLVARFAGGIDPGAVVVDVALGVRPEIPQAAENRCVGVRFGYPRQDCVVESVSVPECRPDNGLLAAA